MNDPWEERRAQREQDQRDYQSEVSYQVWRAGGNPDAIDYERVRDGFYDCQNADDTARRELRDQMPKQNPEEEYYEEPPTEPTP